MRVNQTKLLQAYNTPLRSDDISVLLGEQGDFDKWESILRQKIKLPLDTEDNLLMWYHYSTHAGHTLLVMTSSMKKQTTTLGLLGFPRKY
jgi:hypothetical protein